MIKNLPAKSVCNEGDPGSSLGWEDPLGKGVEPDELQSVLGITKSQT